MNSPRTLTPEAGFTVIEISVVMAILGAMLATGLFFDVSLYRGSSFSSEADNFASILQRARSRAINNVNASDHGVHIAPDSYVLFQGSSYGANPSFDEEISRNPSLALTSPSEIVFSRLSGDSSFEGDITISGYGKTAVLQLNNEGLINR